MNVFIIGTGLIGGSFALDIQENYPEAMIYGIDHNAAHVEEALTLGIIHKEASVKDVSNADVVFLAIPVDLDHRNPNLSPRSCLGIGLCLSSSIVFIDRQR